MKVKYILGAAGSGKLTTCINEMLEEEKKNSNNSIIFIVPEQFSMQAQKILIKKLKTSVLMKIQVLSFKRLAYNIFSELGSTKKLVLEEYGQAMVLRKIINNISNQFIYFKGEADYNFGTIEKIINVIQQFFKYNITLEDIEDILNKELEIENQTLFLKMNDLYIIYKNYLEYLHQNYITSEENLDILANIISDSKIIKNSKIWLYGFTNFNSQELKIIDKLIENSNEITFSFHLNDYTLKTQNLDPFDPFFEVKNTIIKIEQLILKNNAKIKDIKFLNENKRHTNNLELLHLSKNYFSYSPKVYNKEVKNIKIYSANNKYIEIENTAKKILNLVKNYNYKFKDIAIILPNSSYEKNINFAFSKYEIPYFIDSKKSIKFHQLTDLICSVLDIIIYNWNYESVFRYLKTDFILNYGDEDFKITREDINNLENYIIAYGIKGEKWKQPTWEYGFKNENIFDYTRINKTKQIVCKSLESLNFKNNKKYKVKEISTKIFEFIENLNITEKLENISKKDKDFLKFNKITDISKEEQNLQVWNSIVSIFEKFVEILGNEIITLEDYSKILKVGIEKSKIALLPPTQDQVIIGDFSRTKLPEVKALFILSVNEGVVPSFKDDNEFISDLEKVSLLSKGIELSPITRRILCQENLYIYSILTKSKEKIFLSYLTSDLDGKSRKPSFIIQKILQIFKKLKVKKLEDEIVNIKTYSLENIYTAKSTFVDMLNLSLSYNKENDNLDENLIYKDILSWFLKDNLYKEKIYNIRDGINKLNSPDYINKNLISRVYSNNLIFSSVSKLEKFSSCPFSYFLKYNLNIDERKVYNLNSLDIGMLYHSVLEKFSNLVFNNNIDYKKLTNQQIDTYVDTAIKEYIKTLDTDIFSSSKRYKYFLENIKRISKISAYAIIKQLKKGNFYPYGFEVEFNANLTDYSNENTFNPITLNLPNNYKMFLTGKIDRVDLFEDNENVYVKILDYKSSDKSLNFLEIYYGLQLQLIMYLDAFIKFNKNTFMEKNILPAGLFYFQINEPIIKIDKNTPIEKLVKELEKKFAIKGALNNEEKIIKAFDLSIENSNSKNIKWISNTTSLTEEQLNKLRNFVNILAIEIGTEITNGNIKIYPYKYKQKSACQYCIYSGICGIEILNINKEYKISKYNILKNFDNNELWDLIENKIRKYKNQ